MKLTVTVSAPPVPALLRAAIEARLKGRPWPGPEAAVADAVVKVVQQAREGTRWRT